MFSSRDLSGFICKAGDAVQLKFGEEAVLVGVSLRGCSLFAFITYEAAVDVP